MSRCRLTIEEDGKRRVVVLNEWTVEIGRDPRCDLVLTSAGVGPRHCRLLRTDRGYELEDLGSETGSWVNGARVRSRPLAAGDEIRIGAATIAYATGGLPGLVSVVDEQDPTATFRLDFVEQESAVRNLFAAEPAGAGLALLYDLIRIGGEAGSEEDLLRGMTTRMCGSGPIARAQVIYAHPDGEPLHCVASATVDGPEEPTASEIPRLAVERVLEKGDAILIGGEAGGAGSRICVPLRRGTETIGLLLLTATGADPFAKADLELAVACGGLLQAEIERQRARRTLLDENRLLREQVGADRPLVGSAPSMKALIDQVERAAVSQTTVMITGESGTGKELVARALHRIGPRRDRAFVSVNCAVLQDELLASDLFGHVKGAFTGAVSDRAGKFELANGGTLFFDEIGELPAPLQARLLRALEEGEIERVGSGQAIPVDVRVVAATNRDLGAEVESGRFRRDLFFRLNVIEIAVPPLRERPGDVAILLEHYLDLFCTQEGRPRLRVSSEVRDALDRYDWPGNVRELRNLVERWAVMNRTGVVLPDDLPFASDPEGGEHRAGAMAPLDEIERRHIRAVLAACDGNKSRAARILGIDRTTLYDKIARYGLG